MFYLCEAGQYNEYDTGDHDQQFLNEQFEDDSIASDEAFARNLDEELNGGLMDSIEADDSKDQKFSETTCSHTPSASDAFTTEAMEINEHPVDPSSQTMTTCEPDHVLQMLAKKGHQRLYCNTQRSTTHTSTLTVAKTSQESPANIPVKCAL